MHMAWLALGGMLCSLQLSTGSFPRPLSQKEERLYLERAATGDLDARNTLIERNLRLVAHIMKKYYAAESDQEDLISIGTIGLIKAVSSYRLEKTSNSPPTPPGVLKMRSSCTFAPGGSPGLTYPCRSSSTRVRRVQRWS